jgi:hypothetical protein
MPLTLWAYGFIDSTNCPGRTIVAEIVLPPLAGAAAPDDPLWAAGAAVQAARSDGTTPIPAAAAMERFKNVRRVEPIMLVYPFRAPS